MGHTMGGAGTGAQVHFSTVSYFLRGNILASGEAAIRDYLQEDLHSYSGGGSHALPLGLRAGIPELAAQVNLSKALEPWDVGLAEQVEHPSALLLRGKAKPKTIPRPFAGWMEPIQRM